MTSLSLTQGSKNRNEKKHVRSCHHEVSPQVGPLIVFFVGDLGGTNFDRGLRGSKKKK